MNDIGLRPPPRINANLTAEEKVRMIAAIDHDARGPQSVIAATTLRLQMLAGELERAALHTSDADDAQRAKADLDTIRNIAAVIRAEVNTNTAASRQLIDLQQDVMDMLRVDLEDTATQVGLVQANQPLSNVFANNAMLASQAGIQLYAGRSRLRIVQDERLIERILHNLVVNAIRHSRGTKIFLGARRRGGDIVFEVRDNGRGLKPEALERVFQPSLALPSVPGIGRSPAGAGLGLYMVRRFAEKMGGSVHCRSAPAAGTTFEVRLPGPVETMTDRPTRLDASARAKVKDKFVAMIDDDAELLRSTARLFEEFGVHVLAEGDQLPWLRGLSEVGTMPDLFLMDYQLRGQDVESTLSMVKCKYAGQQPQIIIVTGHLNTPALQRISMSTPVLRKPLNAARFDMLLRVLAGLTRLPDAGFL